MQFMKILPEANLNFISLRVLFCLLTCLILNKPGFGSDLPAYQNRLQRSQAVIAVLADTRMTELSDFVIPYGVLKQAKVAELKAVSPETGIIQFFPALQARTELNFREFDQQYPEGADYVIVPALHYADDAVILAWLQRQAQLGATMVAICDGARVLAHAGLLKNKQATSFWYAQKQLRQQFPDTVWRGNLRYLSDQKVITTSGVSAALPASIALVAALAGPEKAQQLAQQFGVKDWSARHDSQAFNFGWRDYWQIASNWLSFWRHQQHSLRLVPEIDEVAVALQADAYSRTYQDTVIAYSETGADVISRNGLRFITQPPQVRSAEKSLPALGRLSAGEVLQRSLDEIAAQRNAGTCRLVRLLLEAPEACREKIHAEESAAKPAN